MTGEDRFWISLLGFVLLLNLGNIVVHAVNGRYSLIPIDVLVVVMLGLNLILRMRMIRARGSKSED